MRPLKCLNCMKCVGLSLLTGWNALGGHEASSLAFGRLGLLGHRELHIIPHFQVFSLQARPQGGVVEEEVPPALAALQEAKLGLHDRHLDPRLNAVSMLRSSQSAFAAA